MAQADSGYQRLKEQERLLQEELRAVRKELAEHYGAEEAEAAAAATLQRLCSLEEGERMAPVIVRIDPRLAGWVKVRLRESGEDIGTFLNGLILADYVTSDP